MSLASEATSKDKRPIGKEPMRASAKTPENANTGGAAIPASGYNPVSGTFHILDTAPSSSSPPVNVKSRFRHIDVTSDHSGNSVEQDSGESEEHKEKTPQPPSRQEAIDNEKREKIRQKNEKKHQRQKEKRAHELHERCCSYLMSRKLEELAQELVAMGFSLERATMALIMNEGRVEESVAWLFEGGEEHNFHGGGTLKINISEELAQIYEMEMKFECSKQEVERAIVACEGNLKQAAETLKPQKPDGSKNQLSQNPSTSNPTTPPGAAPTQQRTIKDFNYTKTAVPVRPPPEPSAKNVQLLKKVQPNLGRAKVQQDCGSSVAERSFPVGRSSSPASCFMASSPLPPASLPYVVNELKDLQLQEPVIPMQRPQPMAFDRIPSYGSSIHSQIYNQFHHQQNYALGPPAPAVAAASSLGLFTGLGSNGARVDWNVDGTFQFDYKNIDWSLDRIPPPANSPNGSWASFGSLSRRSGGIPVDGVGLAMSGSGGGEWSSPFEERDLFGLPTLFVSSPSI